MFPNIPCMQAVRLTLTAGGIAALFLILTAALPGCRGYIAGKHYADWHVDGTPPITPAEANP